MKLLAIQTSSVTNLFIAGNAGQPQNLFRTANAVIDRYKFQVRPTTEELVSDKVTFGHGEFGGVSIGALEVYSDGIIVRNRSTTDIIDAFIEDLLSFLQAETDFAYIESHNIDKTYMSELFVEVSPKVLKVLEVFRNPINEISVELSKSGNRSYPMMQPAGFVFSGADTAEDANKFLPFRLERRFGTDFDKNIFISSAPVPTSVHLSVLENIERSIAEI